MKVVELLSGIMFFIASTVYILVLNHFVNLFGQFYNFFYLFGVCVCMLLGTISLTNSYLKDHSPRYQEAVSLMYAIGGFIGIRFSANDYLFSLICCVLSIYYLVRYVKLDIKKIKNR